MANHFEIRLALAKALFGEQLVLTEKVRPVFGDTLVELIYVSYIANPTVTDWYIFRPDFDSHQAMLLEQWLVKDYVIYYTPRQSHDWRISFQKAPQGRHRWSYFDVKHDNTPHALIKARYEAAMIIIRQQLEKEKDE
jgi:hypothetical protein